MNVRSVLKIPKEKWVEGLIGIEIEAEGRELPRPDNKVWKTTTDGSLQGEAFEYVLRTPVTVDGMRAALKELDSMYTKKGSVVHDSVRAGVHIHINVQDLTIIQLYNFITLYLILEGLLVKWCGPTRDGNLFCLKATDAEDLVRQLSRAAQTKQFRRVFYSDDLRYASMNVKAVAEHGSLEFRSMRGTRDLSLVEAWALMLVKVRESSLQFTDPVDVLSGFSGCDKATFVQKTMGEFAPNLLTADYERAMFDGMRVVQDLVYSVKWERLQGSMSTNPFDPTGDKEDETLNMPIEVAVPRAPRAVPPRPSLFGEEVVGVMRAGAAGGGGAGTVNWENVAAARRALEVQMPVWQEQNWNAPRPRAGQANDQVLVNRPRRG